MKSEVYNMDCLAFMRSLPDNAFALAIADPPYGGAGEEAVDGGGASEDGSTATSRPWSRWSCSGRQARYAPGGGRHYTFGLRKRNRGYEDRRNMGREIRKKIIAWDTAPDEEFFKELRRVSRNQIIWGANYFPNMPPTRCFVVWRKLTISENFSMAMAEYAWTSFNGNAKVYECAPQGKPGDERFHPTQKPVALYSWLIRHFWQGGAIFDPMMGSQSSRIAAHIAGADFVGCELDPDYFAKGNARFEAATRQLLLPLA